MRANFSVVLDACVLANQTVCDLLLRLAEARLFLPVWSATILKEVRHVHVDKLGWSPEDADFWQREVAGAFPEAVVPDEPWLGDVIKVPKDDLHVLSAAIRRGASTIVTFNLKDFPVDALSPWEIVRVHPAEFLITLFTLDPALLVHYLDAMAAKRKIPPQSLLTRLNKSIPAFALHMAAALSVDLAD